MQIIILDEDRKALCDCTDRYSSEKYTVGPCFQSAKKMMNYLTENRIQEECLIITAIQSAEMAKECEEIIGTIKAMHADIKLIVCMGVLSHLDRLFRLSPDYMLSLPLDYRALQEAIEACDKEFAIQHGKYIAMPRNGKKCSIDVDSIVYIESHGRQLELNLIQNRKILFYMQMGTILEKLPDYFVRCHQSFSVNIRYASTYTGEKLLLFNQREIPVSRRYRKELSRLYTEKNQK